jgi:hypothetical protein
LHGVIAKPNPWARDIVAIHEYDASPLIYAPQPVDILKRAGQKAIAAFKPPKRRHRNARPFKNIDLLKLQQRPRRAKLTTISHF